jgi:hypothetical protein
MDYKLFQFLVTNFGISRMTLAGSYAGGPVLILSPEVECPDWFYREFPLPLEANVGIVLWNSPLSAPSTPFVTKNFPSSRPHKNVSTE